MKLGAILLARESFPRLASLRLPPQSAYRLLKYLKLVAAESEVIEQQRVALLRSVSGISQGDVALQPGTPEHTAFLNEFDALLGTDSDLKPFGMTMDAMIAAVAADQGNVLSAADLNQLEPFFTPEPGLTLTPAPETK